jgi:predicted PurR-regulated permease PerM
MSAAPMTNPEESTRFQKLSFLFILALVTCVFLYMVRSFAITVLMAGVFAGLTQPLYRAVLKRLKKAAVASAVTLLLLCIVAILPFIAVSIAAYQEAASFIAGFNPEDARDFVVKTFHGLQERYPALFARVNAQDLASMAMKGAQTAVQYLLGQGANASLTVANSVLNLFLMLFMMFYFYMDGERILTRLIRWSPLRDEHEQLMLGQFLTVAKATLKGILIIGIIQGTIGAILFFAVGLNAPILLGTLMVFASVIPAAGGGLVWAPAALYLMLQGFMLKGIIVIAVGVLVIGSVDNLLRPSLVGKDTKMHDLMVLVSTLGGLGLFGLPGFIIGPVIASLVLTMWTLYEQVFHNELMSNADGKTQVHVP